MKKAELHQRRRYPRRWCRRGRSGISRLTVLCLYTAPLDIALLIRYLGYVHTPSHSNTQSHFLIIWPTAQPTSTLMIIHRPTTYMTEEFLRGTMSFCTVYYFVMCANHVITPNARRFVITFLHHTCRINLCARQE